MKKISLILFVVFGFGLLENVVADINSGLVAHYKFDGSANDSTVNGNNGTENGGVTYVAVKHGQVANFDGNNDDVNVRHNSIFNLTTFSISGWINVEDTSSNQKLFFKDQTNNFNHDFQLYINNSSLIVQLQNGSQQASLIAPSITEGWHHVVFTSNGDSSNNLYMDSILKDTNSISWVLSGNTLDWSFGSFSVEDAYFKGQLDDVSIYNRVLSNTEIQELYQGSISCTSTGSATVDSNLDIHIPLATFENSNIWIDLEYNGPSGFDHLWKLKDYGANQ